jgi:hypothetical protein
MPNQSEVTASLLIAWQTRDGLQFLGRNRSRLITVKGMVAIGGERKLTLKIGCFRFFRFATFVRACLKGAS